MALARNRLVCFDPCCHASMDGTDLMTHTATGNWGVPRQLVRFQSKVELGPQQGGCASRKSPGSRPSVPGVLSPVSRKIDLGETWRDAQERRRRTKDMAMGWHKCKHENSIEMNAQLLGIYLPVLRNGLKMKRNTITSIRDAQPAKKNGHGDVRVVRALTDRGLPSSNTSIGLRCVCTLPTWRMFLVVRRTTVLRVGESLN